MSPAISIVLPCYNAESTVDLTLRSLCNQTIDDIEIIAIDDCSTDSTGELLVEWARRDSRVRVVRNHRNLGLGAARNVAVPLCEGEWLAFVDADDWVTRTFYENLIRAAAQHDADLVRCDHTTVNGLDRKIAPAPEPRRGSCLDPRECILPIDGPSLVDYPYAWAGVYRRSFYTANDLSFLPLRTAEDRLFAWRILLESERLLVSDEHGYMYRREPRPTALTQTGDERQLDFIEALTEVLLYLSNKKVERSLLVKAYRQCIVLLVSHCDRRRRLSAETWYEFKRRAANFLSSLDPGLLDEAQMNFGARRLETLEAIATGRMAIA